VFQLAVLSITIRMFGFTAVEGGVRNKSVSSALVVAIQLIVRISAAMYLKIFMMLFLRPIFT